MAELKNPAIALVVFGMLVTLFLTVYVDFQIGYDLTPTDYRLVYDGDGNLIGNYTIMGALANINIVETMADLTDGIASLDGSSPLLFTAFQGTFLVGSGVIKLAFGMLTLPVEIFIIIVQYYQIPPIVITGIITLITLSFVFFLLSVWIGRNT